MIHVYKLGGDWQRNGIDYTVKAIPQELKESYLLDGWVTSFEKLQKPKPTKKPLSKKLE